MVVLITCKNEEDPIKNEGARVFTTLYINFVRHSRAGNSAVLSRIRPKFELIQAFMHEGLDGGGGGVLYSLFIKHFAHYSPH